MFAIIFSALLAVMPACASEDSADCAWNAQAQANGEGTSFVAFDLGDRDLLIREDGSTVTFAH